MLTGLHQFIRKQFCSTFRVQPRRLNVSMNSTVKSPSNQPSAQRCLNITAHTIDIMMVKMTLLLVQPGVHTSGNRSAYIYTEKYLSLPSKKSASATGTATSDGSEKVRSLYHYSCKTINHFGPRLTAFLLEDLQHVTRHERVWRRGSDHQTKGEHHVPHVPADGF